jgi:hypothetical protein
VFEVQQSGHQSHRQRDTACAFGVRRFNPGKCPLDCLPRHMSRKPRQRMAQIDTSRPAANETAPEKPPAPRPSPTAGVASRAPKLPEIHVNPTVSWQSRHAITRTKPLKISHQVNCSGPTRDRLGRRRPHLLPHQLIPQARQALLADNSPTHALKQDQPFSAFKSLPETAIRHSKSPVAQIFQVDARATIIKPTLDEQPYNAFQKQLAPQLPEYPESLRTSAPLLVVNRHGDSQGLL